MRLFENEKVIWTSKKKRYILTTKRLREEDGALFGNIIKSIVLSDITASQLRTIWNWSYLRSAIWIFIGGNAAVIVFNKFLSTTELFKIFFGDRTIGASTAQSIFDLTVVLLAISIVLTFFFMKKVFSFHTHNMSLDIRLRWLNFEERENFISMVESTKLNTNLTTNTTE